MNETPLTKISPSGGAFRAFEATPGLNVILLPDAPAYTLVAVSNDFVRQSGMKREDVIGKSHFEVFPKSPNDPQFTGAQNLRASFDYVLQTKAPHQIPLQRYDVPSGDRGFQQKYWKIENVPLLNADGEVEFIIHSGIDITSQILSEEKAEATKGIEKAYGLFMNAPVIIGILRGKNYVIELANEGLLEVWGRSAEVVGKPLLEAIPELEAQGVTALLDQVVNTGEPFYAYEFPIALVRNGKEETFYFDFVYKAIYDEASHKATGVISVGHDVTPQVIARRKEQESESKYRSLFTSLDQGFCVLEIIFNEDKKPVDYRILETNPIFEQQTGLQNAAGKTARQLVPDLEHHWIERYCQVALTGEAIRFIEGSEAMNRMFDVYAFPIGEKNSYTVALMFTDISERKKNEEALRQSEQNLRNIILQAPIAMSILRGPEFVVEIANERMYELWGREKKQLLGKSIFEGLPEVKDQGYEELLRGVYTTGKTFTALGTPVTLPRDGKVETVYINLLYEAFREADGAISGIMVVATDVTSQVLARQKIEEVVMERTQELAAANEALLLSNQELAKSNQNLEEFAYAASHDLKEPMRKIHLFSDRLKSSLQEKLSASDESMFDRIIQAIFRMNTLIDDLLMYSHVSRGMVMDEMVDLNKKVKLVLEDLEVEIEEKKARISVDPLPTIKGHRRQLQQLFQNLIGNAIKYSKEGVSPQVTIACRTVTGEETFLPAGKENQPYYLIEVKDNGIGFEQSDADRIFNVFTRLHGKAEYKGTGVGLAIARKVAENHGGKIWAESNAGEGATFFILLPAE